MLRALCGTVAISALLLAAGCGTGDDSAESDPAVRVVASTNVWGDVVGQVAGKFAGDTVEVTSIIDDPDSDPHSYEANTQDQLALSKADIIVENGGGYDDFVDTMTDATDNDDATVLNAVDISGKSAQQGEELNEHVWYDVQSARKLAAKAADALAEADPKHAAAYRSNAKAFAAKLSKVQQQEAAVRHAHGGEGAAITEPVPLYLLQACGLVDKTPSAFSEAIEEGSDVSVRVMQDTLDLFSSGKVHVLAYNDQTDGPETQEVLDAAKRSNVPAIGMSELLPAGKNYVSWMAANVSAVRQALDK